MVADDEAEAETEMDDVVDVLLSASDEIVGVAEVSALGMFGMPCRMLTCLGGGVWLAWGDRVVKGEMAASA